MRFDIMTLFPELVQNILGESIIGRAQKSGAIEVHAHNIRDYSEDKHRRVDDTPYGGGKGMLMAAPPIYNCYTAITEQLGETANCHVVYMSPRGKVFDHAKAKELARYDNLVILCGHYEGVDERILEEIVDEEISIGDYVLTGGEVPACILVDAVARLLPGVLSADECFEKESIASGLLEYPQYTRPYEYHGNTVPDVLLSGHHENIDKWRLEKSLEVTRKRRPDLYKKWKDGQPGEDKKEKKGFKNAFLTWLSNFVSGSAIVRGLDHIGDFLYKKLGSGAYGCAFGSYDHMCETFETGAFRNVQGEKGGRFRRFFAENIEASAYVTGVAGMMRYLSRLSLRVLGVFLLSAGFFSLAAQALLFFLWHSDASINNGVVAAFMMLCGIPLCFSKKPFCVAIYESAVYGRIARDFCGFKTRSFALGEEPTGRKNIAFILGLPFGILSFFVNPILVLAALIGLSLAYIILIQPECGYYAILFLLPFLVVLPNPSITLGILTLYTCGSFILKLIRGKRHFRLELLDVLVLLFMAVMLLGGLVSYGGMQSIMVASIYVILMLGYFLTVSMVNSVEQLKKAGSTLAASLLLVSGYGLYQNYTGNISAKWIDTEMFDSISGRVVSTFENPNMLGLYLILILPMLAAYAIGERSWWRKPGYLFSFAAGGACLIFTWARGAWLGFLFSAVVFMLIWNRRTLAVLLAGIFALPVLVPFLPESIVSRFTSIGNLADTSTNFRVFIWRGCTNMLADYWLTGIGIGESAFKKVYPYYAFSGIEEAPHAHNLFLQLFLEVGVFGFIVFFVVLINLFQCGFSLAKEGENKAVRLIGCGALCGVLAALVQGMTDYVWYNYRVFFVFWLMIGFVAAARRIDYAARRTKTRLRSEQNSELTI